MHHNLNASGLYTNGQIILNMHGTNLSQLVRNSDLSQRGHDGRDFLQSNTVGIQVYISLQGNIGGLPHGNMVFTPGQRI